MEMMMASSSQTIAAVRNAPNEIVQDMFRTLVERWRGSARIAGVIAEGHGLPGRACNAGFLRHVGTGERFPIFQDLGPGSTACHLEGAGALTAARAVQRDIAAGCDLVVLSKFGKLEAGGKGLRDAFVSAMEAHIPLLTSVSAALEEAWARFAGPSSVIVSADTTEIDAWWRSVGRRRD
jgi:hypothetical protein